MILTTNKTWYTNICYHPLIEMKDKYFEVLLGANVGSCVRKTCYLVPNLFYNL